MASLRENRSRNTSDASPKIKGISLPFKKKPPRRPLSADDIRSLMIGNNKWLNVIYTLLAFFLGTTYASIITPREIPLQAEILGGIFTVGLIAIAINVFRSHEMPLPVWALVHEFLNVGAIFVINFSWLYWSKSAAPGACMNVSLTKTDSVYFTLSTLTTVGFGDIHPVSQTCRALVSGQMICGLVLIAVALAILVARLSGSKPQRVQEEQSGS